jgi:hypothetical protein
MAARGLPRRCRPVCQLIPRPFPHPTPGQDLGSDFCAYAPKGTEPSAATLHTILSSLQAFVEGVDAQNMSTCSLPRMLDLVPSTRVPPRPAPPPPPRPTLPLPMYPPGTQLAGMAGGNAGIVPVGGAAAAAAAATAMAAQQQHAHGAALVRPAGAVPFVTTGVRPVVQLPAAAQQQLMMQMMMAQHVQQQKQQQQGQGPQQGQQGGSATAATATPQQQLQMQLQMAMYRQQMAMTVQAQQQQQQQHAQAQAQQQQQQQQQQQHQHQHQHQQHQLVPEKATEQQSGGQGPMALG